MRFTIPLLTKLNTVRRSAEGTPAAYTNMYEKEYPKLKKNCWSPRRIVWYRRRKARKNCDVHFFNKKTAKNEQQKKM
jgi:hypothetical protein